MLNSLPENLKGNLVLTSPSVGLTDDLANEAISILQNRSFHFNSDRGLRYQRTYLQKFSSFFDLMVFTFQ